MIIKLFTIYLSCSRRGKNYYRFIGPERYNFSKTEHFRVPSKCNNN